MDQRPRRVGAVVDALAAILVLSLGILLSSGLLALLARGLGGFSTTGTGLIVSGAAVALLLDGFGAFLLWFAWREWRGLAS